MSVSRHVVLLSRYSLSPPLTTFREIVISEYSSGKSPLELSSVRTTSAMFTGFKLMLPEKITSSIRLPLSEMGLCSPSTHIRASATLLLPEPFGPTMIVTPGSNSKMVFRAKDLKPLIFSALRYN